MERIAVIGSGVAGLAAARTLSDARRHVTLFEADGHFGGHANTVDVTLDGVSHGVDTGFLVFNRRTYPRLTGLFAELGVDIEDSDMSFSAQVPAAGIEWCGSDLNGVFAQRGNLLKPAFWRMLAELLRFNRLATRLAERGDDQALSQPVDDFLRQHAFGREFRDWYLLPMIACIWSCPNEQMLQFPIGTLIRFCHNHGLLQIADRPQWMTVRGGSRQYVRRIVAQLADARLRTPVQALERDPAGVRVVTAHGVEHFDRAVLGCHSDQALALLGAAADATEREVLGALRYQPNRAVLHTDATLLPRRRAAWAAWNYEAGADGSGSVCLHYLINKLQPVPWSRPVIVSMNPLREPRPDCVLRRFDYAHPVFDLGAVAAQRRLHEIQGRHATWFCGAWTGYGFHEDGWSSGLAVAEAMLRDAPAPLQGLAA
jgi:predicted NAD/FAD-binding protein